MDCAVQGAWVRAGWKPNVPFGEAKPPIGKKNETQAVALQMCRAKPSVVPHRQLPFSAPTRESREGIGLHENESEEQEDDEEEVEEEEAAHGAPYGRVRRSGAFITERESGEERRRGNGGCRGPRTR
ncbi:hypothetical protein SKAU_G00051610 [Synaphobranchus kaupii]|uniref:Uncharacterized protein n=1 Tax=Synaphobranchus kaupii TaxID=118154 RepID=A0A9Q1J8P8_SYNKA|nr:hypothetical protein SKAU_G00051610 [Synaphobranchus kaupii]